jgi:5-methyltetrahydrofolate--homocysteine methyltransferase
MTEKGKVDMTDSLIAHIIQSIDEGEPELTVSLVQQALDEGIEPMEIIERGLVTGMNIVGGKFADGEYFLPNLIISASGMQNAMKMLEPALRSRQQSPKKIGVVVIGTVHGDIHEIGKSLVATMLAVNGFEVHDLGVDVPVEKFIEAVKETGANFLCLSALLTTTMVVQRDIILALEKAGLRQNVKVLVGGAPVTQAWAKEIGADGQAEDAMRAVELARNLATDRIY